MNQNEVLTNFKKNVRSILISAKLGLSPEQLRQDYIATIGQPMPLKVLGFADILDMAKKMPDVVSVNSKPNGSILLKAVSDESTRNIEELVSKQRTSKSEKLKSRHVSLFSHRNFRQPPAVALPSQYRGPSPLPAQLKAQLQCLLSQAGPLRLSDLETSFLRYFGYPLRADNFGFCSTDEILQAASDFISIQPSRLGSVVTLREQVVPRQMLRPLCRAEKKENPPSTDKSTPKGHDVTDRTPAKLPDKTPVKQPALKTTLDPAQNQSPPVICKPDMIENYQESQPELYQNRQLCQQRGIMEEEFRLKIPENGVAGAKSQELKEKLQKNHFGAELPLQRSATEVGGAMSDRFHLLNPESDNIHDWIITNTQDDGDVPSGKTECVEGGGGLKQPCRSFYLSSGRSRGESQVDEEDNTVLVGQNKATGDGSKSEPQVAEQYPSIQVLCISAVPLDALQRERLKQPTRHAARELIEVLVEYVESPGHFFIRFCETEEAKAMEDMIFEMRRCYSSPEVSEHYKLPQEFVKQGQVCCVSPSGMWFYRVQIHQLISPTQVEVYYVDFGNMSIVHTSSLKFLKSCYSILPAQAVPSSLAGIKPPTGCWTAEATASFQKLCSDHTLVGALDCYTGDTLQLYLCDTRAENDIYIHSVLLSQGHGVPCRLSARAAVSPVTMYLGEGMVNLPEVLAKTASQHSGLAKLKMEEEELPDLEYIENNWVGSHTQA